VLRQAPRQTARVSALVAAGAIAAAVLPQAAPAMDYETFSELFRLYDRSGVYHDLALAKRACSLVVPSARAEIGTAKVTAGARLPGRDGAGL
jgi:hypothetical protein